MNEETKKQQRDAIVSAYHFMVKEMEAGVPDTEGRKLLVRSLLEAALADTRTVARRMCLLLIERLDDPTVIDLNEDLDLLDAAGDYRFDDGPFRDWKIDQNLELRFL